MSINCLKFHIALALFLVIVWTYFEGIFKFLIIWTAVFEKKKLRMVKLKIS